MSTVIWIVLGVVVVALATALWVRARQRRRQVAPDRRHHQAAREAERDRERRSSVSDLGLWQL